MNRRGFLQSAIAAASALAVDPERLLWTPGAKTIFIPPAPKVVFLSGSSITEADGLNVTLLAGERCFQVENRVVKIDPLPANRKINFSKIDPLLFKNRFFIDVGCTDGVMYFRTAKSLYLRNTKSQTAFVRIRLDGALEVTRPIPRL